MMGIDTVASMLLGRAAEEGLTWADIREVKIAPTGETLTAKFLIKSGEERDVDVNTVKSGVLRILSADPISGVKEGDVQTVGQMTMHADDPGKLMDVPWGLHTADTCIQAGLFSEIIYT